MQSVSIEIRIRVADAPECRVSRCLRLLNLKRIDRDVCASLLRPTVFLGFKVTIERNFPVRLAMLVKDSRGGELMTTGTLLIIVLVILLVALPRLGRTAGAGGTIPAAFSA